MTHQAEYDHKAINIGLLGYGFMGRVHSHAYAVISHLFPELTGVPRLYAVAGLGENELKQFAKQFGYVRYSSCWEQVVNDPEVDAIDICLPEHLHEEVCIAALEAGKHVLCEKPLALSLAEAQRIIEKAATVNVKTMCGFNYRFLPAVRLARDLIQQGKLGRVYMVRGHYCQESGHDPNRPAEQVRYAWGARQLGSIRGLGSHLIDTVRFLVGDAVSVNALLHTFVPERKTSNHESYAVKADEFATLQVEFSNDVVGVLTTTGMATGRKNQLSFEVSGSQGSLYYDLENSNHLNVYQDDVADVALRGFTSINVTEKMHPYMTRWWPPAHNLGWEHGHINQLKHFLECVATGRPIDPIGATFVDGLKAAELAELAWISSRAGKRIYTVQKN